MVCLHQLGQPVAPFILFPVFKSEGEPGTLHRLHAMHSNEVVIAVALAVFVVVVV